MREDVKRRLDRAIWLQRAKWIGTGLACLAGLALMFVWISKDSEVENVRVPATIMTVGLIPGKNVQNGLQVGVELTDGKHVTVLVNQITDPKVGQKVEITEHRHATGRRTYSWK